MWSAIGHYYTLFSIIIMIIIQTTVLLQCFREKKRRIRPRIYTDSVLSIDVPSPPSPPEDKRTKKSTDPRHHSDELCTPPSRESFMQDENATPVNKRPSTVIPERTKKTNGEGGAERKKKSSASVIATPAGPKKSEENVGVLPRRRTTEGPPKCTPKAQAPRSTPATHYGAGEEVSVEFHSKEHTKGAPAVNTPTTSTTPVNESEEKSRETTGTIGATPFTVTNDQGTTGGTKLTETKDQEGTTMTQDVAQNTPHERKPGGGFRRLWKSHSKHSKSN